MTTAMLLRICGDCWVGVLNHEWQADSPSRADFEAALFRMDAERYTMITIADGGGDKHLTIGGGGGRYVVYVTFDGQEFWNLVRPESAAGTVLLNAGGQEGDFQAAHVVTLDQARAAGLVFLDSGQLDPNQRWEKQ